MVLIISGNIDMFQVKIWWKNYQVWNYFCAADSLDGYNFSWKFTPIMIKDRGSMTRLGNTSVAFFFGYMGAFASCWDWRWWILWLVTLLVFPKVLLKCSCAHLFTYCLWWLLQHSDRVVTVTDNMIIKT